MRKILWLIFFFGAYLWVMSSGHDQFVIQQGKNMYKALVSWFDDAEVDFQIQKTKKIKKKHRRWD